MSPAVETAGGATELTVADIARWRGCSRWTAWRWLAAKEREHGSEVVWRRGRALVTSTAALARVAEGVPPEIDRRIDRRLLDLEENSVEHGTRIDGLSRGLAELRREVRQRLRL